MQRGRNIPVTPFPVLVSCQFKERDGMANFLPQGALFNPVRELTDNDLDRNTARGRNTWKALSQTEQKRLLGLIALRQAIETKDALAGAKLANAYQSLAEEILGMASGELTDQDFRQRFARTWAKLRGGTPQRVLAEILTKALRDARLVLWWKEKEKRFLPAVYCRSVATALHVSALLSAVGGKALLVCRHCGQPFVQQRSDQDYCSIRCREAHRVARWRRVGHRNKTARR